jgi:hypothetical protein
MIITSSATTTVMQAQQKVSTSETNQALYNLFVAYLHAMPLSELIESLERTQLDAKLKYVVIYGAACSYCLSRANRLEGLYLRTFTLELKEQLAETLAASTTSILGRPRGHRGLKEDSELPLRQIIDVLQQVVCLHEAERLAISALEAYVEINSCACT